MAVPSSGQLRLRGDIALEVDGVATGINVSLRTLSALANFSSPDNMSEFYGYSAGSPATLAAASASGVTNTQVIANCNVTNDGGATITERGFYFGTSTNMTSNPKYSVGGTTGAFSLTRTGLATSTTYRFWAYATNSTGTTYSARVDAATYPTMNYTTNIWYSSSQGQTYYNSYEGGTVNYSDYLAHPYLGNVTLQSYGSQSIADGPYYSQYPRRYAIKSNDWGSNLARSVWSDSASINYPWWQNKPPGTQFVLQQIYAPSLMSTGAGWAQTGSSVRGYGGYGCAYSVLSDNEAILYTVTGGGTAVWGTSINTTVYK